MEYGSTELLSVIEDKSSSASSVSLRIINAMEDVNLRGPQGGTYLHQIALSYERDTDAANLVPVVFQLSNAGIRTNIQDSKGDTALHIAASKYETHQLAKALLMIGVDPTIRNASDKTALELAKDHDPYSFKIIKAYQPGLWKAVAERSEESIIKLVGSWCKIDDERNGKNLLDLCSLVCTEEILNLMQNNRPVYKLAHAVMAKDKKLVKKMMKFNKHLDVNVRNMSHVDPFGRLVTIPLLAEAACLQMRSMVQKLISCGADVNLSVDDDTSSEPLCMFLMRVLLSTPDSFDILEIVLQYADAQVISSSATEIVDIICDKEYPSFLITLLTSKGLHLFERDQNGYSVREKLYIQYIDAAPVVLKTRLSFVDHIIIDRALDGDVRFLEQLALESFDLESVQDKDDTPFVETAIDQTNVAECLEQLINYPGTIRKLHKAVESGNLAKLKDKLIPQLAGCRDMGGRGLLHKAVMFERKFIVSFLLKRYPETLNITDNRTPLHWAACLKEPEIEKVLLIMGSSSKSKDKEGKTPADYKKDAETNYQKMLRERVIDYGIDAYLLKRYEDLKSAISSGDRQGVEDIRNMLFLDITLDDIWKKMYRSDTVRRDLLSVCVDEGEDEIGVYLLQEGASGDIMYPEGTSKVPLLEAAQSKGLFLMADWIRKKPLNVRQKRSTFQKSDIDNEFVDCRDDRRSSSRGSSRSDTGHDPSNSCSCAVL